MGIHELRPASPLGASSISKALVDTASTLAQGARALLLTGSFTAIDTIRKKLLRVRRTIALDTFSDRECQGAGIGSGTLQCASFVTARTCQCTRLALGASSISKALVDTASTLAQGAGAL